jgi:ABC-type Fe3+/spermidine/putrescine transport system ATPase subunit
VTAGIASRAVRAAETGSPARLELIGIRKALGTGVVVDGIDLHIEEGETLALLGPSGCGKTTTLRMVAGFLEPDAGEIHLSGRAVAGRGASVPTERRQLGMVFQSYAVWPHKSVFDNVAFGVALQGLSRAELQRRVLAALDLVQLADFAKRFPGEISGGQQQRVALARAIVVEPKLLLLDEPLSNLDAALRHEMRLELKRLTKRTGMTSLYVTHDQEEALILGDRVAVMRAGRIEQIDTPEALYRRPRSRFVAGFVGASNAIPANVVERDLLGARLQVEAPAFRGPFWAGAEASLLRAASKGDPVMVILRPEDLALAAPGSGDADARLIDAAFIGNRYDVEVDAGGQTLIAHGRSLDQVRDGRVGLGIAPGAAWAVPFAAD